MFFFTSEIHWWCSCKIFFFKSSGKLHHTWALIGINFLACQWFFIERITISSNYSNHYFYRIIHDYYTVLSLMFDTEKDVFWLDSVTVQDGASSLITTLYHSWLKWKFRYRSLNFPLSCCKNVYWMLVRITGNDIVSFYRNTAEHMPLNTHYSKTMLKCKFHCKLQIQRTSHSLCVCNVILIHFLFFPTLSFPLRLPPCIFLFLWHKSLTRSWLWAASNSYNCYHYGNYLTP